MIGWKSTRSSPFSTADSSWVRSRSREYASQPIDVSNSAMRFLPCSLARYSAMSASRIRLLCAWPCSAIAIPMLAGTVTESSSISTGSCSTSSSRCATVITSATSATPSSRTANSSPPSRAIVSLGRRHSLEPAGHRAQQRVARRVPEAVVDGLEVVEVDEHDRDPRAGAAAAQAGLVEPVHEQRTVRELGEVVTEHPLLELAGELALRGDVTHRHDESRDVPVAEHVHDAHLEVARDPRAVGEDADQFLVGPEREPDRGAELAGDPVGSSAPRRLVESPPDELLGVDPEDRARPRARVRDHARAVDDEDRVVQSLDQRPEPALRRGASRRHRAPAARCHSRSAMSTNMTIAHAPGNEGRDVAMAGGPRVGERDRGAQRDRRQDAQHAQAVGGIDVDDRSASSPGAAYAAPRRGDQRERRGAHELQHARDPSRSNGSSRRPRRDRPPRGGRPRRTEVATRPRAGTAAGPRPRQRIAKNGRAAPSMPPRRLAERDMADGYASIGQHVANSAQPTIAPSSTDALPLSVIPVADDRAEDSTTSTTYATIRERVRAVQEHDLVRRREQGARDLTEHDEARCRPRHRSTGAARAGARASRR